MTERVLLKNPFGFSSQPGLLRQAIHAALFSTALGVSVAPMLAVAAQNVVTASRQSYNIPPVH